MPLEVTSVVLEWEELKAKGILKAAL